MELEVLFHGVNMIEDVVDNPGYDALHGRVVDDSLHGVGLPGWRLSVGKYCAVVAAQDICGEINKDFVESSNDFTFNNVFRGRFVYLGLGYIGLQYFVEHVDFALLKVFVAIE